MIKKIPLLLALLLSLLRFEPSGQRNANVEPTSKPRDIPTVDFCQLIADPKSYLDKVVRIKAIFFSTFESAFLYAAGCNNGENFVGMIYAQNTDEAYKAMRSKIDKGLGPGPDKNPLIGRAGLTLLGQIKYPETRYAVIDGRQVIEINKYRLEFVVNDVEQAEPLPPHTPLPGSAKAAKQEQTLFNAEEKIKRPAPIPMDVLRILQNDERNHPCLKEGESAGDIPASWFVASKIHLDADRLADLIVTVNNPCLYGANVNPFWVFRNTKRGHKLTLSVDALGLEVLKTRTNGCRDISASAATAQEIFTVVYHCAGGRYRKSHSLRKQISSHAA